MSAGRDTNERLKYWLDSRQPDRERMCIHVLMLDRNYSDVQPRRPEGGPDGARDIQAKWKGVECFGAVGFRNKVTDSADDKRAAAQKFRDDLAAALEQRPGLKAFVFFTNVDLTPGEVDDLKQHAFGLGVTHTDVYWRERIRLALDSPEGLALRYQYLEVELSASEQASFFSRFGRDLEALVTQQFRSVEDRLKRLEFLQWQSRPLRDLTLQVRLKAPVTAEELGHFRIFLELEGDFADCRNWYIGGRDDYLTSITPAEPNVWCGVATFCWTQLAPDTAPSLLPTIFRSTHLRSLRVASTWPPGGPFLSEQLHGLCVHLFVTKNLVDLAESVLLHSGPYTLISFSVAGHPVRTSHPNLAWPEKLTEEEKRLGWVLYDCGGDWPWQVLDFTRTPSGRDEAPVL
jgi:hypothetical protein